MSGLEDEIGALSELRAQGAASGELTDATGWQVHSVRATLTGLRNDGKELTRTKDDAGETRYRLGVPTEMEAVENKIAVLHGMTARELRATWRALHSGEPMAPSSRDLMIREIAYKMQERAHGGLAPAIKRRLRALAKEIEADGAAGAVALAPLLKAGTRLVREWGGKTRIVITLDDGFEYEGERYRSLTEIARRITGAHWSGPRFFGMRKAAVPAADPKGPSHE